MTLSLPFYSPDVLAAIDLGSNSFRLEIAQLIGNRYKRHAYYKEMVRLGGGLTHEGYLTKEAADRGLACLTQFAQYLKGFSLAQVRAVATQTLREAKNRDDFLLQAQAVLGYPIEVITGREEARLIYLGVARLQPSTLPRLVIDIGGRSTEMVLGQGLHTRAVESFQIGSVSLSMRFFPDGRLTKAGFHAAQVAAGAELEEALDLFARNHWKEALGSSGTVGAVSQVLLANQITDGTITPDGLRWCIQMCLKAGHYDALILKGLKPERRAVFAGGLAILYTLSMYFDIEALHPAKGALRQGVIYDLDSRIQALRSGHAHDLRDDTVRDLQHRFGVDLAQATRVRQVAGWLYEQILPKQGWEDDSVLTEESRRELAWAAALHEVGMMVSHHDHHRHSAYLIGHVDAAGFSQSQQRRIADLALGQRGSLHKLDMRLASVPLVWQVLCLRLAVVLCHARVDIDPTACKLVRSPRTGVRLQLAGNWLASHPQTLFLLEEEIKAWAAIDVVKLTMTKL